MTALPQASGRQWRGLIERQPVDGRSHGLILSRSGRVLIPRIK